MSFDLKIKNKDLVIEGGDFKKITDVEKLTQDILKIALTSVGSNPSHPWYGSYLSRSLIGSGLSTDIIYQFGQSQLQNCIENLKSLQDMQVKNFQRVSADEQIGSILNIGIDRNISDPRLFNVSIKVATKGFKISSATFTINTI